MFMGGIQKWISIIHNTDHISEEHVYNNCYNNFTAHYRYMRELVQAGGYIVPKTLS